MGTNKNPDPLDFREVRKSNNEKPLKQYLETLGGQIERDRLRNEIEKQDSEKNTIFLNAIALIFENLKAPQEYKLKLFVDNLKTMLSAIPDAVVSSKKKEKFLEVATKQENFKEIKVYAKEAQKRQEAARSTAEKSRKKCSHLTESQNRVLGPLTVDKTINIGRIAREAKNIDDFKDKITGRYLEKARLLISKLRAKKQAKDSKVAGVYEEIVANKTLGQRDGKATDWLEKKGGAIGAWALGDVGMWGAERMSEDPFLKQLLTQDAGENKKFIDAFYGVLKDGKGDEALRKVIRNRIDIILGDKNQRGETLKIEDIRESFASFGTIDELKKNLGTETGKNDVEFLRDKMGTITKSWKNSDMSKKYDDYVRKTGYAAVDFPKWIELKYQQGEISIFVYYWHKLLDMIPEEILNFCGIGDSEQGKDKEVDKYGKEYMEYERMLQKKANPGAIDDSQNEDKPEKTKQGNQLKSVQELKALYEKKRGSDTAPLNILVDGKKIENAQISEEEKFSWINTMLKEEKGSYQLLSKGLELEDIQFLAEHRGDQNADGINVEFGEDGFEINKDLSALVDETVAEWTIGVGGTAVALYKLKKYWKDVKGIRKFTKASGWGFLTSIGLWIVGQVSGEMDVPFGGENIKYSDDCSKISQLIKEQKSNLKKVKEMIVKELDNLSTEDSLTVEDLNKVRHSSAFQEFIDVAGDKFMGNYKITPDDIKAFIDLQGTDKEGGFDDSWLNSVLDAFHEETIDEGDEYIDSNGEKQKANGPMEGFEVNGTGEKFGNFLGVNWLVKEDLKFVNVEGFFAWLRANHEKSKTTKK